jgi:periplasmic protein TonB
MKTNLNIFVLAAAFLVMQACTPKSKKNEDEYTSQKPVAMTVAEKRAKAEKDSAERAEKRRIAFIERAKKIPTYTDSKGELVYNKAEVDPAFTGGNKAMMKYLHDNITYPKDAEDNGVEGTVFVDFIITGNGNVREVLVTDGPDDEASASLRAEAIRVVSAMPRWVPGKQNGQPVQVCYSLPISFQLN